MYKGINVPQLEHNQRIQYEYKTERYFYQETDTELEKNGYELYNSLRNQTFKRLQPTNDNMKSLSCDASS